MPGAAWEVTRAIRTSAGMFGLWQPERFIGVTSLDAWENEVSEDAALLRHIEAGAFVPINIGADGAFQFTVRGGSSGVGLTERERQYVLVSSQPYLLISNGTVSLGGLEAVGSYTGVDPVQLPLGKGRYSVRASLIDWKAEPGFSQPDGEPTANALSDFVIEVREEVGTEVYRSSVETFDCP
jgi:hypothetical protein